MITVTSPPRGKDRKITARKKKQNVTIVSHIPINQCVEAHEAHVYRLRVLAEPCEIPSKRRSWVLIFGKNPLRYQLFGLRSVLDLVFEAVGQHVFLEFAGVGLQSWSGGGCGEDVALATLVPECESGGIMAVLRYKHRHKVDKDRTDRGRKRRGNVACSLCPDLRSTNSSFSGRFSRCFFRLSEARWRSSSWRAD